MPADLFSGIILECFFYGLYSAVFILYLHYHYQTSKKDANKTQNLIFCSISVLYVLSTALFFSDMTAATYDFLDEPIDPIVPLYLFQTTSFGCCDFIAQFILIYRCWIVWGRNIRVVAIPSILAFTFLATWLAGAIASYISSDELTTIKWEIAMNLTSLALSLTVNALVTGLIVFRILKVFRKVKVTSDDQKLGAPGGSKLRRTILVLIESGMTLFSIQLVRFVLSIVWTDAAIEAFTIIAGIHEMLTGITPTIILVRISMGLSFHDEKSMEEVATGSLHFMSNHLSSISETGSISTVGQDIKDDDDR